MVCSYDRSKRYITEFRVFNSNETFNIWKELKGIASLGDRNGFESRLGDRLAELELSSDELRVLFYVALNCERWAYTSALDLYRRKSHVFLDVQTERLNAFSKALTEASKFIENDNKQYLLKEFDAALVRSLINLK